MEFERRIQLISPDLIIDEKPNSDLIFSILNEAQDRYVMMNYVGDDQMETETNIHTRNTDSIKSLLVEKELTATGTTLNGFTRYRLPYVPTEEYFLYVHSFSKVKGTYKQYKDFDYRASSLVCVLPRTLPNRCHSLFSDITSS